MQQGHSQPPEPSVATITQRPKLADHFLECGRVGRYLTLSDESRFVVTDDFKTGLTISSVASATASVFSRDALVAQAALLPLGLKACRSNARVQDSYDELFNLIEKTALSPVVRDNAEQILKAGFQEARIHALERELGDLLSPARARYRAFLGIVKKLIDRKISVEGFREEFLEFTKAVAGKLDFGIFSFCLDRIFANGVIPMKAKGVLIEEILLFPQIIRREIITNLLSKPDQSTEIVRYVRSILERELENEAVVEIYLLVTLKTTKLSVSEVETMFLTNPDSALDSLRG